MAVKVDRHAGEYASREQIGFATGMLEMCFAGEEASEKMRHTVQVYLFGVESAKDLTTGQVLALLDWLKPSKDNGGAYAPDPMAAKEAHRIVEARVKELGQSSLL